MTPSFFRREVSSIVLLLKNNQPFHSIFIFYQIDLLFWHFFSFPFHFIWSSFHFLSYSSISFLRYYFPSILFNSSSSDLSFLFFHTFLFSFLRSSFLFLLNSYILLSSDLPLLSLHRFLFSFPQIFLSLIAFYSPFLFFHGGKYN